MNPTQSNEKKKTLIAMGCIVLATAGLVLGIFFPAQIGGAFSAGTLLALVAYLLSLSAVKEHGSNIVAILAHMISFFAMAISIFCSGMSLG